MIPPPPASPRVTPALPHSASDVAPRWRRDDSLPSYEANAEAPPLSGVANARDGQQTAGTGATEWCHAGSGSAGGSGAVPLSSSSSQTLSRLQHSHGPSRPPPFHRNRSDSAFRVLSRLTTGQSLKSIPDSEEGEDDDEIGDNILEDGERLEDDDDEEEHESNDASASLLSRPRLEIDTNSRDSGASTPSIVTPASVWAARGMAVLAASIASFSPRMVEPRGGVWPARVPGGRQADVAQRGQSRFMKKAMSLPPERDHQPRAPKPSKLSTNALAVPPFSFISSASSAATTHSSTDQPHAPRASQEGKRVLRKIKSPRGLTPLDIESVQREADEMMLRNRGPQSAVLRADISGGFELDGGRDDGFDEGEDFDMESLLSPGLHKSDALHKHSFKKSASTQRMAGRSPRIPPPYRAVSAVSSLLSVFHACQESSVGRLGACVLLPAVAAVVAVVVVASLVAAWLSPSQPLRLNEIQLLGSRFSYHLAPPNLGSRNSPEALLVDRQNFTHVPLRKQLDGGYRFLHLELYYDPKGGHYAERLPSQWKDERMMKPGFKVMHVPELDFRSSCLSLVDCLHAVLSYSNAHPLHLPIMVQLQVLDTLPVEARPIQELPLPLKCDEQCLLDLEEEVLSVFPRDRLVTPDDVRGSHATLAKSIRTRQAWPTLEDAAGKVLFFLGPGQATTMYRKMAMGFEADQLFSGQPGTEFPSEDEGGLGTGTGPHNSEDSIMESTQPTAGKPVGSLLGRPFFPVIAAAGEGDVPNSPEQAVVLVETTSMASMARDLIDAGHFVVCPVLSLRSAFAVFMWDQAVAAGCQVIAVEDLWMENKGILQPHQLGEEARSQEQERQRHRERGQKGAYEVKGGELVEVPLLNSVQERVQVACLPELNSYACVHKPYAPITEPVIWG